MGHEHWFRGAIRWTVAVARLALCDPAAQDSRQARAGAVRACCVAGALCDPGLCRRLISHYLQAYAGVRCSPHLEDDVHDALADASGWQAPPTAHLCLTNRSMSPISQYLLVLRASRILETHSGESA